MNVAAAAVCTLFLTLPGIDIANAETKASQSVTSTAQRGAVKHSQPSKTQNSRNLHPKQQSAHNSQSKQQSAHNSQSKQQSAHNSHSKQQSSHIPHSQQPAQKPQVGASLSAEQRQQILPLGVRVLAHGKNREEWLRTLSASISATDIHSLRQVAEQKKISLSEPLKLSLAADNRSLVYGAENEKVMWDGINKGLMYRGKQLTYDRRTSVRDNLRRLEKLLRAQESARLFYGLLSEAHAKLKNWDQIVFDLHVLTFASRLEHEEIMKQFKLTDVQLEKKLQDLVGKSYFAAMECRKQGAKSSAVFTFTDGGNYKVELVVLKDQNGMKYFTRTPDGVETPFTSKNINLLRELHTELCTKMTPKDVDNLSSDLVGAGEHSEGTEIEN